MLALRIAQDQEARRNHSAAFKALASVKGEEDVGEPVQQYDVLPNLINQWPAQLLKVAADVFGAEQALAKSVVDVIVLHVK